MNIHSRLLPITVAGLMIFITQASAEENHCKLLPEGRLVGHSYEHVGARTCKQACRETEGCTARSYLPHTFSPETSPGECRMLSAVAEQVADEREFCGRL